MKLGLGMFVVGELFNLATGLNLNGAYYLGSGVLMAQGSNKDKEYYL